MPLDLDKIRAALAAQELILSSQRKVRELSPKAHQRGRYLELLGNLNRAGEGESFQ